jgi:hypothetical protein
MDGCWRLKICELVGDPKPNQTKLGWTENFNMKFLMSEFRMYQARKLKICAMIVSQKPTRQLQCGTKTAKEAHKVTPISLIRLHIILSAVIGGFSH